MSWFNDFIGRFSHEIKPRPQKLANIIDRLTPAVLLKQDLLSASSPALIVFIFVRELNFYVVVVAFVLIKFDGFIMQYNDIRFAGCVFLTSYARPVCACLTEYVMSERGVL